MAAAGTLEIQLIADVARLQKDMRDMQRAVDSATGDMSTGFDRTGKAAKAANDNIGNLAIEADRLRSKIDPMYTAQKRFNQEMDAADALLKKGMISTREHAAAVDMARKALNDHAVSVAGNATELGRLNPKVMEAGETSKLSRHHVMNLGYQFQDLFVSLASGQKPTTVFIQQGSQIASVMADAGVGIGGTIKQLGGMVAGFIRANPIILGIATAVGLVTAAVNLMADDISKSSGVTVKASDVMLGAFDVIRKGISTYVTAAFKAMGLDVGTVWDNVVEFTRKAINLIIGVGTLAPRTLITAFQVLPAAIADIFFSTVNNAIGSLNGLLAKATLLINAFISGANSILGEFGMAVPILSAPQISLLENSYAGAAAKAANAFVRVGLDTINRDFIGELGSVIKDAAVNRATQSKAEEAGDSVGKAVGSSAGKSAGDAFGKMFSEAIKDVNAQMGPYKPLVANDNIDDILAKQAEERNKVYREQQKAFQDNLDYATNAAREIGNLIGGTFGKGVADLGATLSKNFPELMSSLGGSLKGVVESIDGVLGKLGTSFKEIGAFAGVGGSMSSIVGGSAVGGSIGGAAGGLIGESFKALGKFGGPLGAIAGGILGSVIGGLFKKTKQASATIEAAAGKIDVGSVVGNDSRFKSTVSGLAGSVVGGINKIAQSLGAEIEGAFKMSIGQRDKKFVVDAYGQGRTKGSGTISFETEAEAIAYAIDNAIRSGILGGIERGTSALLRGAGDLENRLQKALDFEGVFRAMAGQADPFKTAMDGLDNRFRALILTFQEAGATSEEWATLEKYYQMEREKAIREGNAKALEAVNSARDQLTEAYNRESEAILTTLERFQNLTADLESFRASLAEQLMTAEQIYKAAKERFDEVAKLAVEGNEKAIADLVSVSQKYLDAAKNFLTPEEYNREIQNVMKAVDLAIVQTKTMEDYAQLQLDALNNSVDGLITLNASVLSVKDAIAALADAQSKVQVAAPTTLVFNSPANSLPDFANMTSDEIIAWAQGYSGGGSGYGSFNTFADGGYHSGGLRIVGENGPELEATGASRIYNAEQTAAMLSGGAGVAEEVAALRSEMKAAMYQIAKNTGKTSDQLQRWDGDGMPEVRDWTAA